MQACGAAEVSLLWDSAAEAEAEEEEEEEEEEEDMSKRRSLGRRGLAAGVVMVHFRKDKPGGWWRQWTRISA